VQSILNNSALQSGYGLLFLWVLAEQAGLPIPAVPMLLAAGAMAADGKLRFGLALIVGLIGSMLADASWYEAGRFRGMSLIHSLCRLSLEKDSCARQTQKLYGTYGAFALVIAKFVPGLNFAAPPLSGVFRMKRWRFLLFNAIGALSWITVFMGLGFLFSTQLTALARETTAASHTAVAVGLALAIAAFVWWKYRRRAHFLRQMQTDTISPKELKDEIDQRSPLIIIDVRHPLDLLSAPYTIPNAIRIPLENLATQISAIPRDQKVVIYCTCPSQASSSRALQVLRSKGFPHVQVLAGGFQAWKKSGFAVQEFQFDTAVTKPLNPIWAF
jgi:membrane protein DedA with SNARE-associated domain/rhodanese-related sulfurtransferase